MFVLVWYCLDQLSYIKHIYKIHSFCIVNVQKHDFYRSIFQQINSSSHENLNFEGSAQKSEIFFTTPAQPAISRTSDSYFSRILVMRSGNFSSGFCEADALKNFIYWERLKNMLENLVRPLFSPKHISVGLLKHENPFVSLNANSSSWFRPRKVSTSENS